MIKPIDISEKQCLSLIDMAEIVFPGEWTIYKASNNIIYLSYKESPDSKDIKIHWLDFCLYQLYPYFFERIKYNPIRRDYDFTTFNESGDSFFLSTFDFNEIDIKSFAECFIMNHPVDYLAARYESIINII
jgi:hypothetical protein